MNCLFPYKATVGSIIKEYKSNRFFSNMLFDKHYMIKKVFKELIDYLQVDEKLQKMEINKAIKSFIPCTLPEQQYNEEVYNWLVKELNVLIGALYEQEMADIFINYQLTPDFTNTTGKFINMTDFSKMKMPDIIVQSFQDESYYAFDIKSGIIWRKQLTDTVEKSPIWVYNTGFTVKKINELYFSFKQRIEQQVKNTVHMYVLFVCYDMLTKVNFDHQAEFYQLAFNDTPNHVEKVCFALDLEQLFVDDDNFINDKVFNSKSEYLLKLKDEVEYDETKAMFLDKYAVRLDSPICMTLKDFIHSKLI